MKVIVVTSMETIIVEAITTNIMDITTMVDSKEAMEDSREMLIMDTRGITMVMGIIVLTKSLRGI